VMEIAPAASELSFTRTMAGAGMRSV
jgi:hypothetical protein